MMKLKVKIKAIDSCIMDDDGSKALNIGEYYPIKSIRILDKNSDPDYRIGVRGEIRVDSNYSTNHSYDFRDLNEFFLVEQI